MKRLLLALALLALLLAGCRDSGLLAAVPIDEPLSLPEVTAVNLDGRKLRVVATTSIIGDIVRQVGGDAIELVTLMRAGQDPHSYEPSAADLARAADADVIFVNGWNLEEGLLTNLARVAGSTPLVPVSAGISPLMLDDDDHDVDQPDDEAAGGHDKHDGPDPHVWQDPRLVMQWVRNIEQVLAAMDPAGTAVYQANAAAYQAQLEALQDELAAAMAQIPAERRQLVTNHDTLGYFARAYDFRIVGTVLPATSTVAEPSASALARLVGAMRDAGSCTLFTETTANPQLAEAVARELRDCPRVQVLALYTDALGPEGSSADSYLGLMRTNAATIQAGLAAGR